MANPEDAPLLDGIRVVEMGQYIPAPYAGLMLSELGADVIKIEPPAGDPMRHLGTARIDGTAPGYHAMNGGKRVTFLDLKTDAHRQIALDLLAQADVLIESYRPGVLDRLGLGRDVLTRTNPALVHCSISGFGQTGPYAAKAGHDLNYMAAAGALHVSGTPETPVIARTPISDYASAMQGATTILAALLRRERKGLGAHIDVSMTDTALSWQSHILAAAMAGERPERGRDFEDGGLAAYNIYRTSDDRFIGLGAEEPKFWKNFCHAIGRQDWLERFREPMPQLDLSADLAALFQAKPAAEWAALLEPADCCFQLLLTFEEALEWPQFVERRIFHRTSDGAVHVLFPAWIDNRPPRAREAYRQCDPDEIGKVWTD